MNTKSRPNKLGSDIHDDNILDHIGAFKIMSASEKAGQLFVVVSLK